MLTLGVIGLLWLGCLIAFVIAAIRAPTLDYMSDQEVDRTAELVAELRRLAAQARNATAISDDTEEAARLNAG